MPDQSEYWREQLQLNQRLVGQADANQRRWAAQAEFNDRTTRVAEEVVEHRGLLEGVRSSIREAFGRLIHVESRADEHQQRLDAHADLIGQQGQQICDLQDSRVATNRRVSQLERDQNHAGGSFVDLLILWAIVMAVMTAVVWLGSNWVGDHWYSDPETLWRDDPSFGSIKRDVALALAAAITACFVLAAVWQLVRRATRRLAGNGGNAGNTQQAAREPEVVSVDQTHRRRVEDLPAREAQPTAQMAQPANGRY